MLACLWLWTFLGLACLTPDSPSPISPPLCSLVFIYFLACRMVGDIFSIMCWLHFHNEWLQLFHVSVSLKWGLSRWLPHVTTGENPFRRKKSPLPSMRSPCCHPSTVASPQTLKSMECIGLSNTGVVRWSALRHTKLDIHTTNRMWIGLTLKMFLSPGMLKTFYSLHEAMNKNTWKSILNEEIIILISACLSPDKHSAHPSQAAGHFILVFEETTLCLGRLALTALKHLFAQSYLQSRLIIRIDCTYGGGPIRLLLLETL